MRLIAGLMVLVFAVLWTGTASAERRMALVIGNGDYIVGPLDNPTNDAKLIAKTLESTGFEVTLAENLGYRDLQRAIVGFGRDLRAAGEDTVGMVYYAGHAVQANGQNYLIPVDADLQDELDLEIQTLAVSTMMRSLDSAGNRLNMVVLDACRNNPFKSMSRSASRGLAKVDAPRGTLVAYSTAPGNVALDGAGQNSPYTKALARALREPGLPVEQVFKKVRISVMEATGQQQVPWESSSLTGDFFFLDAVPEPPTPAPAAAVPQANPQQAEIAFWTSIANSNDPAMFQSYLQAYPSGLFAAIAQQRVATLEAQQAAAAEQSAVRARNAEARGLWETVQNSTDAAVLQTMIAQYPDTVYAQLAQARIQTLAAKQEAAERQSVAAAPPRDDGAAERLFWQSIQSSPNKSDYEAYLAQYPEGTFAAIARDRAVNGYRPQVAALTTGPAVPDGDYTLSISATGSEAWDWCRGGESVEEDITISDGKFSGWVLSSFGASGNVRGRHLKDGSFEMRMISEKYRKITWTMTMKPQGENLWVGDHSGDGKRCPLDFRLTRR